MRNNAPIQLQVKGIFLSLTLKSPGDITHQPRSGGPSKPQNVKWLVNNSSAIQDGLS